MTPDEIGDVLNTFSSIVVKEYSMSFYTQYRIKYSDYILYVFFKSGTDTYKVGYCRFHNHVDRKWATLNQVWDKLPVEFRYEASFHLDILND